MNRFTSSGVDQLIEFIEVVIHDPVWCTAVLNTNQYGIFALFAVSFFDRDSFSSSCFVFFDFSYGCLVNNQQYEITCSISNRWIFSMTCQLSIREPAVL